MEEARTVKGTVEFVPGQSVELILDIGDWVRERLCLVVLKFEIYTQAEFLRAISLRHDNWEGERAVSAIFNYTLLNKGSNLSLHLL